MAKQTKTAEEKRERDRLYQRKWAAENRDALRAVQKRWRDANRERIRLEQYKNLKTWRAENLERARALGRNSVRLRKYGLTVAQFDAMFEKQGRCCAICESDAPNGSKHWSVDHCHETRRVRGILCHHCNLMLGHAKDDAARLRAAAAYLDLAK